MHAGRTSAVRATEVRGSIYLEKSASSSKYASYQDAECHKEGVVQSGVGQYVEAEAAVGGCNTGAVLSLHADCPGERSYSYSSLSPVLVYKCIHTCHGAIVQPNLSAT